MRDIEIQRASARDESINLINASGAIKTPSVTKSSKEAAHQSSSPSITDTHTNATHTVAVPTTARRAQTYKKKKNTRHPTRRLSSPKSRRRRTCTRDGVPTHRSKESVALRVGLNIAPS